MEQITWIDLGTPLPLSCLARPGSGISSFSFSLVPYELKLDIIEDVVPEV